MKHIISFLIISITAINLASAQCNYWHPNLTNPTFSSDDDVVKGMVTHTSYHTYILSETGTAGAIGPGSIHLSKIDENGHTLWTNTATCEKNTGENTFLLPLGITTDVNENIYVTVQMGDSGTTLILGNQQLVAPLGTGQFVEKSFILKFNKHGNLVDDKYMEAPPLDIAVDDIGNVYMTGLYGRDTIIDNISVPTQYWNNFFLLKCDANFNPVWVKTSTQTIVKHTSGTQIEIDNQGDIYVSGLFASATLTLDGTILQNYDTNADLVQLPNRSRDIFVAKYNSAGTQLWVNTIGGTDDDKVYDMSLDKDGNPYLVNQFASNVIYYNGSDTMQANAGYSSAVMKINKDNGLVQWRDLKANIGFYSVGCSRFNKVYVAGSVGAAGGQFGEDILQSIGGLDVFVAQYDSIGQAIWGKSFGGTGSEFGQHLSLDYTRNRIYIAGEYNDGNLLNGNPVINHYGGKDIFIRQLREYPIAINVTHFDQTNLVGKAVELWSKTNNQSYIAPIENNWAVFDTIHSYPFMKDIDELYILDDNSEPVGKIGFVFKAKNYEAGRCKEALVMLHNELVSYKEHPKEKNNVFWHFPQFYKYDYKEIYYYNSTVNKGVEITGDGLFQTSMLIPPFNEKKGVYALRNIKNNQQPIVFVHGVSGTDNYWDGTDNVIIQNPTGNFGDSTDYAYSSYPARFQTLDNSKDVWEYYYPPDQSWKESGFLLGQDLAFFLQLYTPQTKASIVAHSMGDWSLGHI